MSQTATTRQAPAARASDPAEVVRAFLGALDALDIDGALALAAPEIVYHNKGLPPARGYAAFERQMQWLGRSATAFEARIHNLAANGPIVLTERTDVLTFGRFEAELWVCGTFEVRDGQIVLWRDYFDYVTATLAGLRGLVAMLLRRR